MSLAKIDIRTKDGKRVWLSVYTPAISNGRVIIIAPGGGMTKDFYDPFALFFEQQGYSVVAFDYRGMGSSAPAQLKGYEANMHQWAVQDIDAVILFVKNNHPKQEIIYIGHCIGGEIAGLAQASQYICKLVLIDSSLSCKKLWPLKDRIRMMGMKMTVRVLNKIFGYFPGKKVGLPADIPKGVMYEWTNWCNNPNGLFGTFPDSNYRKLHIPLLAFSFSDDWHCPPRAVQELLNHFSNAVITWHHMEPREIEVKKIGHAGFFHSQFKPTLWAKLLRWINEDEPKEAVIIKL